MDDFYAVNFENTLPPMSEKTWLVEYQKEYCCKTCGHCTTYLRSEIRYEREKLQNALDFNLAKEYVDNWDTQEIIVSAKARKVFKENKIRIRFDPVTIL